MVKIFERNAVCDRCGFIMQHFLLRDEWTGLKVCKECWEPRHPQDFQKIPRTEKVPEWTRPRPTDIEVSVTYNTTDGIQENTIPTGTFTNSL